MGTGRSSATGLGPGSGAWEAVRAWEGLGPGRGQGQGLGGVMTWEGPRLGQRLVGWPQSLWKLFLGQLSGVSWSCSGRSGGW